jgi:hypothetical protein
LITAGNDGVVYAWRAVAGAIDPASRAIVGKHTGAVSGLAVSRDGNWLASGARDDVVIRTALDGGASDIRPSGGAASAIAFDRRGDIQAVTRTGAVVHATPSALATVIDHGALSGVALGDDRLAVALDDGAIVIETLGPHTLDELTRAVTAATAFRVRQ